MPHIPGQRRLLGRTVVIMPLRAIGRTSLLITLAALLGGACSAEDRQNGPPAASHKDMVQAGPVSVRDGPVRGQLSVDRTLGRKSVYVSLANASDQFMCIGTDQVDTRAQAIVLRDSLNNVVPRNEYRERGVPTLLGFDYESSYYFVLPHETRRIPVAMSVFVAPPGVYTYQHLLIYFACNDIVDPKRIARGERIPTFATEMKGVLDLTDPK